MKIIQGLIFLSGKKVHYENHQYSIMKRLLITSLFLFTLILSKAQSRIGYSLSEIKTEFPSSKYNIEFNELTDTSCIYTVKEVPVTIIYLFDHSDCTATFIIPQTSTTLKSYIEEYNNKYVKVSQNQWKVNLGNGICRIDLESPENDKLPFFLWTRQK